MRNNTMKFAAIALSATLIVAPFAISSLAARPADYQQARSQGLIGETPSGYLEVVGSGDAATRALVNDINNKRREEYFKEAQIEGVTPKFFGERMGCKLIAKTARGEKYKTPDGSWMTRTADDPIRDPQCSRLKL